MATLLRPPLIFRPQPKRPLGTPDVPQRPLTLIPQPAIPKFLQLSESSPPTKYRPQVDCYPNLLTTTLAIAPPDTTNFVMQVFGSAPERVRRLSVDAYPNLLVTTLAPPSATIPLPLSAVRWDWPAPQAKSAWRIDQPMQRAVWLDPVPQVQRLDASAPWVKYRNQVDAYPNMLVLGINPNATPLTLNQSAPPPKFAVQVDAYPNLQTLLSQITVPNVVGETQAQATADLNVLGLIASILTDYSDTVPAGLVISQAPAAGSIVLTGDVVSITLSLGARPANTGAGKKRRHYLEIDGQSFEVRDAQHAQALLERAREVARSHAQEIAAKAVQSTRKVGRKPVSLPTPRITSPDPELREVIREARKSFNELYRSTAIDAELALLMARTLEMEDEEEAILLLM